MLIRGVAFDLEGTVVDVENAHHKGHFATAKDVGVDLNLETALKLVPHFIGGPDEKIAEEIWDLSDKKFDKNFIAERDKYYYHEFLKSSVIQPRFGFIRVLEEMRKAGLKTSIGSLTGKNEAEVLLKTSGLDKIFFRNLTVLREDVKNIKPAPDVFFETAIRMGISSREQIVFEDSPNGIKAAVMAGSTAIGMPVYGRSDIVERLVANGAIKIFKSWDEVNINELLTL